MTIEEKTVMQQEFVVFKERIGLPDRLLEIIDMKQWGRYMRARITIQVKQSLPLSVALLVMLHECGHAIQHRDGTDLMYMRSFEDAWECELRAFRFCSEQYERHFRARYGEAHKYDLEERRQSHLEWFNEHIKTYKPPSN